MYRAWSGRGRPGTRGYGGLGYVTHDTMEHSEPGRARSRESPSLSPAVRGAVASVRWERMVSPGDWLRAGSGLVCVRASRGLPLPDSSFDARAEWEGEGGMAQHVAISLYQGVAAVQTALGLAILRPAD